MRYPIERVRPLAEDEVDRAGMEVQQCMELAATNRPRAWPREASLARKGRGGCVQYAVLRVRGAEYRKPGKPGRGRMREWLSWWSTTLPRSGPRVRVPSRALIFCLGKSRVIGIVGNSFFVYIK